MARERNVVWKSVGELRKAQIDADLTPDNLTDQEVLSLKVRQILKEWYKGVEPWTSWLEIDKVVGGYKVWVSAGDNGSTIGRWLFIADELINQAKVCSDYSINTGLAQSTLGEYMIVAAKWEQIAGRWNELKMNANEVATKLTYQRYFNLLSVPIRKLM